MHIRPGDRLLALSAVALVQLALGAVLLWGLRVDISGPKEAILPLIHVMLPSPPRPRAAALHSQRVRRSKSAAPKPVSGPIGGSPVRAPSVAPPTSNPVAARSFLSAAAGEGNGSGPAVASGTGGGSGGQGAGDDGGGGTDLVQIAGAILPKDYPRDLRERGVGGRVGVEFVVDKDGRVSGCTVTRSSGVPELDALTCRLIRDRFRYRPSTDRFGQPIPDEVEGEQDWIASRG
jgi:periplasmic protein TonB